MTQHVPVLPAEIIEALAPQPGDFFIDGTCGGGGHTRLLAERVQPGGWVLGVDRDQAAIDRCHESLLGLPVKLVAGNFADIPEIVRELGAGPAKGILLDLGLSSDQLADEDRGFSYSSEGLLDLRFDSSRGVPAWKLLERLSEKHLADLIFQFGEERFSRKIARRICERKHANPVRTASELAALLLETVPRSRNHSIHPATRTFQALRIAVNSELKWIEVALRRLPELLAPGGRVAVISFHSLEDRLAKHSFRENPQLRELSRKPVRAGEVELMENPRSRSARLRIAERVENSN
jgi:16S rRNA (cytosine1402-N4)-methyltransferase